MTKKTENNPDITLSNNPDITLSNIKIAGSINLVDNIIDKKVDEDVFNNTVDIIYKCCNDNLNKKYQILYDHIKEINEKYQILYDYIEEINKSHTQLLNNLEKEKYNKQHVIDNIKKLSMWQRIKLIWNFIKKGNLDYGI